MQAVVARCATHNPQTEFIAIDISLNNKENFGSIERIELTSLVLPVYFCRVAGPS
jgi:hypothetical protein